MFTWEIDNDSEHTTITENPSVSYVPKHRKADLAHYLKLAIVVMSGITILVYWHFFFRFWPIFSVFK